MRKVKTASGATGGAAALLADAAGDLRAASGASSGAEVVRTSGPQPVTYAWSESQKATVRAVAGQPEATREYPDCRLSVATQARMATIEVRSGAVTLRTRAYMRN